MKKNTIAYIGTLLIVVGMSVIMHSCQKEKLDLPTPIKTSSQTQATSAVQQKTTANESAKGVSENSSTHAIQATNTPVSSGIGVDVSKFFEKNVAFVDARIRSLNSTNYVRELVFVNFSAIPWVQAGVYLEDTYFHDDGLENDVQAGDGIFTSKGVYVHSPEMPYDASKTIRSVMDYPVANQLFNHHNDLSDYLVGYPYRDFEPSKLMSLTCDITFGGKGCRAEQYGWCESCCIMYSNCKFKLGF